MVENYRDPRLVKLEDEMKREYPETPGHNYPIQRDRLEVMLAVARNNAYPCNAPIALDGLWGDDEVILFSELEDLIREVAFTYAMSGA